MYITVWEHRAGYPQSTATKQCAEQMDAGHKTPLGTREHIERVAPLRQCYKHVLSLGKLWKVRAADAMCMGPPVHPAACACTVPRAVQLTQQSSLSWKGHCCCGYQQQPAVVHSELAEPVPAVPARPAAVMAVAAAVVADLTAAVERPAADAADAAAAAAAAAEHAEVGS